MGLFDLFGKKSSSEIKSLEEYLRERSVFLLLKQGKGAMEPFPIDREPGIQLFPRVTLKYLGKDFLNGDCTPIPKCYYDKMVEAKIFFELAYEKESSEAAFYLAVMYEHGLGVEKDQEMADQYYNESANLSATNGSKSIGQKLTEAMRFIKNGNMLINRDYTGNQSEDLAATLFLLNLGNDVTQRINELFDGDTYLLDQFIRLGVILVGYYASKNYPYSMYLIGNIMKNHGKNSPYLKELFNYNDDDTVIKSGNILMSKCNELARSGNMYAQNIITSNIC